MNALERSLVSDIPLEEAAGFFHRLKTAGWSDPPDMTGALEGMFVVDVNVALQKITGVVTTKFRKLVAYYTYAESMRDLAQHEVGTVFHEHAGHELEAAEYYLKRAAVLGGAIHLKEIDPPPASTDPIDIVMTMIRAEQEAIAEQRELRQMVGDESPMRVEIDEHLAQDQHHLDELWQMLPAEAHQALDQPAEPSMPVDEQAAPGAIPDEDVAADKPAPKKDDVKTASDKKEPPTDRELRETGRQRAVTALSAEAHREKGRRGERAGETLGRAVGAAGGAVAGKKLIGGKAGTIAGLAAGLAVGGRAGKELGSERDIRKNAAARFKLAATKLALEAPGGQMAPPTAPSELQAPTPVDPMGGMSMGPQPPAAPPAPALPEQVGGQSKLMPTQFLEAEMAGRQAQEQNESAFYRSKLQETQEQAQATEQQLADTSQQLEQLNAQQGMSGQQIQQATQEAMAARDDALRQSQLAANMRMGMQKLRQQLLDIAAQEPDMMGGLPTDVQQGAGQSYQSPADQQAAQQAEQQAAAAGGGTEGAMAGQAAPTGPGPASGLNGSEAEQADANAGPAGAAAGPELQPNEAGPGAGVASGQQPGQAPARQGGAAAKGGQPATQVSIKTGAPLAHHAIGALGGALIGGGAEAIRQRGMRPGGPALEGLQQQIQQLQGQERSLGQALELAKAKSRLAHAEFARDYPGQSIARSALAGGAIGGMFGPEVINESKSLIGNLGEVAKSLRK